MALSGMTRATARKLLGKGGTLARLGKMARRRRKYSAALKALKKSGSKALGRSSSAPMFGQPWPPSFS